MVQKILSESEKKENSKNYNSDLFWDNTEKL